MSQPLNKRILVAPLDWGLGHASRCIPVIRNLQHQGHEVILASAGRALNYLKEFFPELKILEKPTYNIQYSKKLPVTISILLKVPSILKTISIEHKWLNEIIRKYKIDEVVSDNCYGLWNKSIHSTIITHQLNIKCPKLMRFAEPFINRKLQSFINKFDECRVPDMEGDFNYAGELSHPKTILMNLSYIGLLSRFSEIQTLTSSTGYDLLVLLSGPEPHRTAFENKIERLILDKKIQACIIRGLPGEKSVKTKSDNISWLNHADDELLATLLKNSIKIICRAGYSTIMDLAVLDVSAILIPTPGQTEQEYLAVHNKDKRKFTFINQDKLTWEEIVKAEINNKKESKNLLRI